MNNSHPPTSLDAKRPPAVADGNGRAAVTDGRLPGVDGLRAIAALWVLLFHMRAFSHAQLPPGIDLFVRSGSTGVSLFLVLSGFCLYLPVAGGQTSRFQTVSFFRRRCSRLLPAYFASLFLVLLAHLLAQGRLGLPKLDGHDVLVQSSTHVLLVHQLFPSTFYGLNGAYWSLGLEWELYLTLPLLVLAVRRVGLTRTVLAVTGLTVTYRLILFVAVEAGLIGAGGVPATVVLPNLFLGRWSEFAMGMLAAELYRNRRVGVWRRRWIAPALIAAAVGLLAANNPLKHVLFGVVFFALLLNVLARDTKVSRALSWRPLVAVGVMSYSLYLVHQPLVQMAAALIREHGRPTPGTVFLILLALVPAVMACAWLLFITVERRSINSGKRARAAEGVPGDGGRRLIRSDHGADGRPYLVAEQP